jgi:hypothetical protein
MHDGLPGIAPPDIGNFEHDLRQLRPPGPEAVSETADRPLDNVSIHDFAFHEYLLAPRTDQPDRNVALSDAGAGYLGSLSGQMHGGILASAIPAAVALFTDIEVGIRQALNAYWQETHAQMIADTFQHVLDVLYGNGGAPAMHELITDAYPFLDFALVDQ